MKNKIFDPAQFLAVKNINMPEKASIQKSGLCRNCGCNCAEKRRQQRLANFSEFDPNP